MSRLKKDPPVARDHYEIQVKDDHGDWCIGIIEEEGEPDDYLMFSSLDEAMDIYKRLLDIEAGKDPGEKRFEIRIAVVRVWGFPSGYIPEDIEMVMGPPH